MDVDAKTAIWLRRWPRAKFESETAAGAYALACELDFQADITWSLANNPDVEDLLGNQLPWSSRSFLLDPDFLPRMAASARYMADAIERNERWPMPRCTADEVTTRAAWTTVLHTIKDKAEIDPVLSQLASGLDSALLVSAAWGLRHHICKDEDVCLLYDPAFDGIENSPEMYRPDLINLRIHDWFKPFGHNDELVV